MIYNIIRRVHQIEHPSRTANANYCQHNTSENGKGNGSVHCPLHLVLFIGSVML